MNPRRFPPALRWTLPAVFLVVGGLVAIVAYELESHQIAAIVRDYTHDQAALTAVRTATEVERQLRAQNTDGAREELDAARVDPLLNLAMLLDEQRRVLFSTDYALEGRLLGATDFAPLDPMVQKVLTEQGRATRDLESGTLLWLLLPVQLGPDLSVNPTVGRGVIAFRFDLSGQLARGAMLARNPFLAILALLALQVALAWWILSVLVTRRIGRLVAATRAITNGDFSVRTGLEGGDELARLARRVDQMTATLGAKTRELEDRERWFRQLIEQGSDVLAVLDDRTRVIYVSPSVSRVLGRTPDELLDSPLDRLVEPADAERFASLLRRALAGEKETSREEIRVRGADGEPRILELVVYGPPEFLAVGQCVLNARDLTAWRRLEDQLRQSQKLEAIGRLAGGIAHDFNNLLTAILGYTELLAASLPADSLATGELAEIERAAKRAADLTSQLLAFGRRQMLQPALLDLNQMVAGLVELLRRFIGERIELVIDLTDRTLVIRADRAQIENAIVNLAINARDAMPKGGRLTLASHGMELDEASAEEIGLPAGPVAVLTLTDTGVGMSAEIREHAFEPFFTTKEVGRGTGLGLSTVLGIVEQTGGSVRLDSAPGQGAKFELYFPISASAAETAAAGAEEAPPAPRGGATILVVEDEAAIRRIVVSTLSRRGYQVLEAASASEAVELGRRADPPIDLLITDLMMPVLSGQEVATAIRQVRPEARVLFMTGYSEEMLREQVDLGNGTGVLGKPFTARQLVQWVEKLLPSSSE